MASPQNKDKKSKDKKAKSPKPKVKASGVKAKKTAAPAKKTVDLPKKNRVSRSVKGPVPRLQALYRETVGPGLLKDFKYKSPMQIPRLEKVVLNIGMGEAIQNSRLLDSAVEEMTLIAGQKPVVTRAKKSIAGFKLRAGMSIGCKVTLRGRRMYEFLDRFLNAALPRIRDFRGVSPRSFDGAGNYSLGLKEQLIFPEIEYDKVVKIHGMDISINTTARTNEEGRALLAKLGMPFRK